MPSYWYFPGKALKRRIAYINAYFRGELDEMRSATISYANVVSKTEMVEKTRQIDAERRRFL